MDIKNLPPASTTKTSRPPGSASGAPSASSTSGPRTCTASGATTSPRACSCCAAASSTSCIAIGLGSLVIFFLMNLVGYAGVKTGVPYPVLARASFGVWGANLPALVRAVVACFWYGAQTAAASGAIVALLTRSDSADGVPQEHALARPLGAGGDLLRGHLGAAVAHHPERHGDGAQVPGLGRPGGLGRDAGARRSASCVKAGGFSFAHGIPQDVLLDKTKDAGVSGEPGSFWALMAVGATWITYFAALYLNFCDFSRYAHERRRVKKGNLWGLPVNLMRSRWSPASPPSPPSRCTARCCCTPSRSRPSSTAGCWR